MTMIVLVMIVLIARLLLTPFRVRRANQIKEHERWMVQVSSATSNKGVMLYAHEVKTNQFIYQSMDPKDFLDTVTEKAKQANAKRLYVVGVDFEATQVIKKYLEKIDR